MVSCRSHAHKPLPVHCLLSQSAWQTQPFLPSRKLRFGGLSPGLPWASPRSWTALLPGLPSSTLPAASQTYSILWATPELFEGPLLISWGSRLTPQCLAFFQCFLLPPAAYGSLWREWFSLTFLGKAIKSRRGEADSLGSLGETEQGRRKAVGRTGDRLAGGSMGTLLYHDDEPTAKSLLSLWGF